MNINKLEITWRVSLLYILVFIMASAIGGKIFSLQVINKKKWKAKATKLDKKDYSIPTNRGNICDENGYFLACSLPFYELRMDLITPALTDDIFYDNIDGLAKSLANLFKDKSPKDYKKMLIKARKNKKRNFLLNRKLVSHQEFKKAKTFPILKRGKIKGGFIVNKKDKRLKPYEKLAMRTIGYMYEGFDGKITGRVGLEEAYENHLRGIEGINVKRSLGGKTINEVKKEPIDGKDIITCININFQDVVQSTLYEQLKTFNAEYGCVVLMETNTGEIKAISNLRLDEENNEYIEDYNYAIGESSEPGSIFKLASAIALLEDGFVDLDDVINTKKGITHFYGIKMSDSYRGGYGKITFREVFEKSSNVGISTLIHKHYEKNPKRFIDRLYDLHLNEPLGIKIKGEGIPIIKYPNDPTWSGISLPWMSIGYEIKQTPLHVLTLYNAIANNGKMLRPRLVKEINFHGKTIKGYTKLDVIDSRICSKETLQKLKIMLKGVVNNGTASKIKTDQYEIAGKTGTAMIADKNKGYQQKKYRSSFVGYFPADNPKYSCIVMIVNPDNTKGYYGSTVAAPVFRFIADRIYAMDIDLEKKKDKSPKSNHYNHTKLIGYKENIENLYNTLDIPIANNINAKWVYTTKSKDKILLNKKKIITKDIPDIKGMGLKDAIYLMEKNNIKVNIKNYGDKVNKVIIHDVNKKNEKQVSLEMI